MRRIAIFNDTSPGGHCGCYVVMRTLVDELKSRDIEPAFFWPVGLDWRVAHRWLQSQKFDAVLVNGEGSIHNSNYRTRAQYLCELATYAHDVLKVPSFLINSTFCGLTEREFFHMRKYDLIYARDAASEHYLKKNGVHCSLVPDLSFFAKPKNCTAVSEDILVTDSVLTDVSESLQRLSFLNGCNYYRIEPKRSVPNFYIDRCIYKIFGAPAFVRKSLKKCNGYDDFIEKVACSYGVITGRFHAVTLSLVNYKPFWAIESNTPKISNILYDVFGNKSRMKNRADIGDGCLTGFEKIDNTEILMIRRYIADGIIKKNDMFDSISRYV